MNPSQGGAGRYNHVSVESTWAAKWLEHRVYEPELLTAKKPFYNLMMFPYPSAEGLHVGNMYAFSGADIFGRFQRMRGYDVFEPIGLDGFGIHSENYAIKIGKHPEEQAKVSEKNFYRQLSMIGNGFAWDERLETYDPEYYKWTQWLFVQMYNHGLAYKASAKVNWCPSCKTVLSDEQVEDGVCERCKSTVERKEANQWFFKITEYADQLLKNIETLKWPEKIKIAQRQWIGKKEGIEISYPIDGVVRNGQQVAITVFTTRPDTNFGATFIVVAPEHALVSQLLSGEIAVDPENKNAMQTYVDAALNKSEQQRQLDGRKKTGVFTGLYAINQLNSYKMPIYIADFVLAGFGTGAVVGVPGHDLRDFEFAKAMNLPIIRVVVGKDGDTSSIEKPEQVQEEYGVMINSEFLNGLDILEATQRMMDHLEQKGWGKRTISYHLRDWLISRQRFWGPPIPMVHCEKCGWQPVPESQLPVLLPHIDEFKPTGDGKSPLERAPESWLYTECPKCHGRAKRETDVSDTFLDSSWYFLRYPCVNQQSAALEPFNKELVKKWRVNAYIGGAEHAVLHLLYARFVTMALKDWGHLDYEEPFSFLFGHGLIIKDGAKMSKSRGNVVNPDEYIEKFGADTLRTYLMFLGPYDQGGDFRDTGIAAMERWLQRVWTTIHAKTAPASQPSTQKTKTKLNWAIKKCTQEMEAFRFNTSIAALMECVNVWNEEGEMLSQEDAISFIKLLAPFAPYMTEEIFQSFIGVGDKFQSIHTASWPTYDETLLTQTETEFVVQVNGKMRARILVQAEETMQEEVMKARVMTDLKVQQAIGEKQVKKVIFVPGKLINLVVG